jgi:hypothetical protein
MCVPCVWQVCGRCAMCVAGVAGVLCVAGVPFVWQLCHNSSKSHLRGAGALQMLSVTLRQGGAPGGRTVKPCVFVLGYCGGLLWERCALFP